MIGDISVVCCMTSVMITSDVASATFDITHDSNDI